MAISCLNPATYCISPIKKGTARVYDTKGFRLVADIQLAGDDLPVVFDPSTIANDIVLTKTAAYVTDSIQPQLYKVNKRSQPIAPKVDHIEHLFACTIDGV